MEAELTSAGILLIIISVATMKCGPCHRKWGHSSRTRNRLQDEIEIIAAPPATGERFNEAVDRQRRATSEMLRRVASPVAFCVGVLLIVNGIADNNIDSPMLWFAPPSLPPGLPMPASPTLSPPSTPRPEPVPLIIDTDMSFDVDDVGAVCVAHALADRGEAALLAIVHDSGIFEGIGAVAAINEYYGRRTKLGAYKGIFGSDISGPCAPHVHPSSPPSNMYARRCDPTRLVLIAPSPFALLTAFGRRETPC
jgi:hypothetical protein